MVVNTCLAEKKFSRNFQSRAGNGGTGKVLVSDAPAELMRKRGAKTLEEAFISYLMEAQAAPIRSGSISRRISSATCWSKISRFFSLIGQ